MTQPEVITTENGRLVVRYLQARAGYIYSFAYRDGPWTLTVKTPGPPWLLTRTASTTSADAGREDRR
jgi:hypothetical protein